jgi:ribosomal protein S27AE
MECSVAVLLGVREGISMGLMTRDAKTEVEMKGIKYTLTFGEIAYMLFRSKSCPKCNAKMVRHKDYEIRDDLFGSVPNQISMFAPGQDVKVYSYHYVCPKCNLAFPLSELAKRRG